MPDPVNKPKAMTRDELKGVITDIVKEVSGAAVSEAVSSALGPIKEQQTQWFANLEAMSKRGNETPTPKDKLGYGAARFLRAMAFGRGDVARAKYFAEKAWDDALGERVKKSLQAGDLTAGGALVPPEFASEIIELLRSRAVVRAAGARVLPMNNGTLTLRRHATGASASYVGESRNISKTEPTTDQLVLSSKKLAAIVPISNDLLTFASGNQADEFVRDDLVMEMAVREDSAFIRDDGTQDKPKGMRYWAHADNITATNGTSATNIEDDFKDMLNALETNDVRMLQPAWFMNPRSKNHLRNLRDANGNLIYPEMRNANPTLHGYPVFNTTNIPINLGGGTATELYLADMVDMVIGEATQLEVAVDSSASYIDANGNLVSAFARDETLMRTIARHDFAARHSYSIAVKTGVTWGA